MRLFFFPAMKFNVWKFPRTTSFFHDLGYFKVIVVTVLDLTYPTALCCAFSSPSHTSCFDDVGQNLCWIFLSFGQTPLIHHHMLLISGCSLQSRPMATLWRRNSRKKNLRNSKPYHNVATSKARSVTAIVWQRSSRKSKRRNSKPNQNVTTTWAQQKEQVA